MGARLVLDLNPSGSSSPQSMISIDGMLYFTADLGSSGEGGQQTSDTDDDVSSGEESAQETTAPSANQLGSGLALLKSDGTTDGTRLLKEFQSINDIVEVNGELYFIADDGTGTNQTGGNRLWRSDGTARGTVLVKDLFPGADPNFPQGLFEIDGVLFYSAINSDTEGGIPPENGYELWRREGNGIGSPIFKNIIPDKIITEVIIETQTDEDTGASESTTTITTAEVTNNSFPRDFSAVNGNLFFVATTSYFLEEEDAQADLLNLQDRDIIGGYELWFSDGTESGTRPIVINTNLYDYYAPVDVNYAGIPSNLFSPDYAFTTNSASSFPRELTSFSNNLVFTANDGLSGFELWTVSDQGDNPKQISDLSEGNTSSSPEELTVVGNRLYFTANDNNGRKLWTITNTLGTPTLVEGAGEEPKHLSNINGQLYFSAKSQFGRELWVANSDSASLVADINPGSGSSSPRDFTSVNHWVDDNIKTHLYFSANDGERGVELWSIDLSDDNSKPQRHADILSGPSSSEPRQIMNAEERLYFTADDGLLGRELWTLGVSIQGPIVGKNDNITVIKIEENQKKVYQFSSKSAVRWSMSGGVDTDLFKIKNNGSLIFKDAPSFEDPKDLDRDNIYEVVIRATDEETGTPTDLMVNITFTNAITGGLGDVETILVKDILKGGKNSNPSELTQYKNDQFFAAENSKQGNELWKSGGSKDTTSLVKDISPGKSHSMPNGFTLFKNELYFSANDGNNGVELWRSDGTSQGTNQVADLNPGPGSSSPSDLVILDNKLIFSANDGNNGSELWGLSKGSNNPVLIHDINPDISSAPKELTKFEQKIYFSAEGEIYGRELWETDGTKNGTKLVFDINPGGFHSNPRDLTIFDKKLYFTAETYTGGRQFWISDGSDGGTHKISPLVSQDIFSGVEGLTSTREQLFFSANSKLTGNNNSDDQELGRELWSMKGNLDSINLVLDINPGAASSNPTALTSINNILYFSADDGSHGEELWMSDGTREGTVRLTDINQGSKNSSPGDISEGNDGIYFSAIKDDVGRELWRLAHNSQGASRIISAGTGKKKLKALDDSNDEFRFELADQFGKGRADQITGFSPDEGDKLVLSTKVFPGLSEINLVTVSSKRQLKAQQTQPSNVIYFEAKGKLYFDQNETKKGYGEEGGLFAILEGGPDLTESSFQIV